MIRRRFAVHAEDSLFGRASKALGWSFVNTAVARLGTLAIGIVLARILGPTEFGVFAVAMVALLAVLSFNELGVSLAIVRWPGEPREIAPTVTTISVVSSCLIYAACFLGAPAFSSAMGAPQAAGVIRLLTLNVVINGVVAAPAAMLQRHFRQDRKLIADQVNNWGGALVSIGLALAGWGAMSLAIGRLAGSLASGVLFVVYSPVPLRFGFDRAAARALLVFGLPLAGSSVVVFAVASVDQLIVGNVLGATVLGFYVLAFNLSSWPVGVFSQPVRSVAPAAFARLQHDPPAMRTTFLAAAGLLTAITLPACLLLSGAAQPLIHFMYGGPWRSASAILAWLAILGGFRIAFELMYDYFVVLARTRAVFTVQLIWLAVLVPALILGARYGGAPGVAAAQVAVAALVVLPLYLNELSRVGIGVRAVLSRIALPLVAAVAVGLVAAAAHRLISADIAAMAIAGVLAVAAMGAVVYRMRDAVGVLKVMERTDAA